MTFKNVLSIIKFIIGEKIFTLKTNIYTPSEPYRTMSEDDLYRLANCIDIGNIAMAIGIGFLSSDITLFGTIYSINDNKHPTFYMLCILLSIMFLISGVIFIIVYYYIKKNKKLLLNSLLSTMLMGNSGDDKCEMKPEANNNLSKQKKILIVVFDLKSGSSNQASIYEYLKNHDGSKGWMHYIYPMWLIDTDKTSEEIVDAVSCYMLKGDRIFVSELKDEYQGLLPKKAWEWIKKHNKEYI